ncbi:MAG: ATP-binding cassette domain-containing protein [Proteobacteria bacterium]|nr:ATP-binding cassette domain-containing protein [Pseudomonadota bacterium]
MDIELTDADARHPASHGNARPALRGVSLRVAAGEQVAIIGPSGAGKTTLAQVLALALKPGRGTLRLGAADPWQLDARALRRLRQRLFLAPQVPPLPPRQRVVHAVLAGSLPTLGLGASLRSLIYPHDIAGARAVLEPLDLADKLFERVDRLSGGERQRVALARASVSPASLWLLDEPLSALDPARAGQALTALTGQARARGITLVATLHQVELALAHFDRVVALQGGVVVFDAPSASVTPAQLTALYGAPLHTLADAPSPAWPATDAPAPVMMTCR